MEPGAGTPYGRCFTSCAFDRETNKKRHTDFYGCVSTTCRKSTGFIRVIYAHDRKHMVIRANTTKYGSLAGEKKNIRGARLPIFIDMHAGKDPEKNMGQLRGIITELRGTTWGGSIRIH